MGDEVRIPRELFEEYRIDFPGVLENFLVDAANFSHNKPNWVFATSVIFASEVLAKALNEHSNP